MKYELETDERAPVIALTSSAEFVARGGRNQPPSPVNGANSAVPSQPTEIIRDQEQCWRVVPCIGRNPQLAGLDHQQDGHRWIDPECETAGWRFFDGESYS